MKILLLFFYSITLKSEIIIDYRGKSTNITQGCYILEDKKSNLNSLEIQIGRHNSKFVNYTLDKEILYFSKPNCTYWVRFVIINNSDEKKLVLHGWSDDFNFYYNDKFFEGNASNLKKESLFNFKLNKEQHLFDNSYILFNLPKKKLKTITFDIRNNNMLIKTPLIITTLKELENKKDLISNFRMFIYIITIFSLILIIIHLIINTKYYINYFLLLLFTVLKSFLFLENFTNYLSAFQYFRLYTLFCIMHLLFLISIVNKFFELKKNKENIYYFLQLLNIFCLELNFMNLVHPQNPYYIGKGLVFFYFLLYSIIFLISIINFNKNKKSKAFALSWLFIWLWFLNVFLSNFFSTKIIQNDLFNDLSMELFFNIFFLVFITLFDNLGIKEKANDKINIIRQTFSKFKKITNNNKI